ncbi:MAG: hypothetical protein ACYS1A_20345 [Planctomycetota bacterium]|jgi:hypothetical protein
MKIAFITIILLFVAGCGLDLMTDDNPLGFKDPNQGAALVAAAQSGAATTQAVGVATGNPALIGGGVLAGILIAALGGSYLKGKKNG